MLSLDYPTLLPIESCYTFREWTQVQKVILNNDDKIVKLPESLLDN